MTYVIANDLSIRIIEGEIFVLKRKTSTIHSFNKTGTMIWKLLQEKKTHSEIVQLLVKRFEVSMNDAENDVSEFFFNLLKNQLIVTKD